MSDKPPPRPPPIPRSSEAPPLPRRPVTSVPPPIASRTFSVPAPVRAPVAKPIALSDEEQATKLFSGATTEQAELVVVAGQYKGKTVPLGAGTVVIGRSGDCELSLKGANGASRRHCKVQYLGNRFVVIDLESRNGTVVNGQSVERKVLEQGDRIEIGDEVIQFIIHRLADLAIIDDGLNPFEVTGSKTVRSPEPAAPPTPAPVVVVAVHDSGIATAPPQPAFTSPIAVVAAPAPMVYSTPPPPPSRAPYVFGALAIVVLGGGAALVHDLWTSEPDADPAVITTVVDAGSAPVVTAAVDAGSAPVVAAIVDAGSAPVVAAAVDAGAPAVAAIVDAGSAPVVATPVVDGAVQIVRASAAGRASVIKVKVGDRVAVGDVLVVLGGDNGTMARKLQALQREEREFAEAASKDSSLRGDLEEIRREMKKVAARLETTPLKATHAGVVVEVLVKQDDVVRDAAPIVTLSP